MPGPEDREILDLTPERPDEGKIRYTYSGKPPASSDPAWLWARRLLGAAIGLGVFILMLFFFVYVILPIIVIFLIWVFIRGLFRKA